ncbi:hypothetical protein IV454_29065 [Massilia antarctica]|uniref:Uncharacterized protein n=1 Tax=Massilia antarctica TaxID=2765360 RepID=A0AA49A7U0_9BURK|nr:hypothetical protein [Massilia antarctica]QPI49441.1 hypothetical protein IV454_29065 [Massilia antarctica]
MSEIHPDAALRVLLEGSPVLRLTLRDRDYGMPCPTDRWQVKAAVDDLLKPALEGMVLDLDVVDATGDDVLVIGVVDLNTALPKLRDLLKSLSVPAGATLVLDGGEENLVPDLPTRDELVRQTTDSMIQMVLAECIESAPSDWQAGTLTIQCDGNWLGYQLKNAKSRNSATISGRLRAMCEEIAVLMWKNGNKWREAVLQYEGKSFTVKFSYEEPLHPIPRSPTAAAVKPWWKLW